VGLFEARTGLDEYCRRHALGILHRVTVPVSHNPPAEILEKGGPLAVLFLSRKMLASSSSTASFSSRHAKSRM
jgi:hypothetical protein